MTYYHDADPTLTKPGQHPVSTTSITTPASSNGDDSCHQHQLLGTTTQPPAPAMNDSDNDVAITSSHSLADGDGGGPSPSPIQRRGRSLQDPASPGDDLTTISLASSDDTAAPAYRPTCHYIQSCQDVMTTPTPALPKDSFASTMPNSLKKHPERAFGDFCSDVIYVAGTGNPQ